MAVDDGGDRGGDDDALDAGGERGGDGAPRALDGGADQLVLVGGHFDDEGGGDVLDEAATGHCLFPARIGGQVKGDELEARDVAPPQQGFSALGPLKVPHRAANGVALGEELQGDMAAEKAGNAGDEDAVGHEELR